MSSVHSGQLVIARNLRFVRVNQKMRNLEIMINQKWLRAKITVKNDENHVGRRD